MRITSAVAASFVIATLAAAGCSQPGAPVSHAKPPSAVEDLEPQSGEEALQWLVEGNARFVAGKPRHGHEELIRRAKLAGGQHPFAIVLGCADSRVPPEIVFDHGLGDLFVIRVAGNVVADDEAGSIEYAVDHLGVPLIVVLGHEGCGAVTAALGVTDEEPAELRLLMDRVRPALTDVDRDQPLEAQVHEGVESNVRRSVTQLLAIAAREDHPEAERVLILGAVYELETGRVRLLDRASP